MTALLSLTENLMGVVVQVETIREVQMLLTPGTIRLYKNDLVVYKRTCICYFKSSIFFWAIAIGICGKSGSQNSGTQ